MRFLLLLLILSSAAHAELPERLKPVMGGAIKLAARDDYQGAIEFIEKSRAESAGLKPIEQVIYGNLLINQYLNLKQWDDAETLLLELLIRWK